MFYLMMIFIAALSMGGGLLLGGYFIGLAKGYTMPRTPKSIDYSNIIEVGDTIGFKYATHYHEGIVEVILNKCGEDSLDNMEDIDYVIRITRDDSPRHINWVGRCDLFALKYSMWTMIKKNPKHYASVDPSR